MMRCRHPGALVLFIALLAAGIASAQTAASPQPVVRNGVRVIVANRPIITLYGPVAGYSAADRAEGTTKRIQAALEREARSEVTTAPDSDGTMVLIGGNRAFLVTAIDIEPQFGETTANVAREAADRLRQAIAAHAEQHTLRFMATATALVALATLVYALVLRLLFVATRRAGHRIANLVASHSRKVNVDGVRLLDQEHIGKISYRLMVVVAWILGLFATYLWLTYSFERIPYTQPYGEHMQDNLGLLVGQVAGSVVRSIPGLLVVLVIILLVRAAIGLARVFFARVERGEFTLGSLDADTVQPTRRLVEVGLWLFALALAFPFLPGASTDAFKGVSVLVGVMASIGASSVLGQAFAGLSLMYSRAIRVGEYVRLGETEGTVTKLGFFATRIRTPAGEEVVLPNSTVMQGATRNYSRAHPEAGLVVDANLSIGYDTPWRLVESMMLEAARRTPEIAAEPKPLVRQLRLDDFYPVYQLIAFTPRELRVERPDVLNRLHANIQDVFAENGVQIMSPHYVTDPAGPKVPPKA